ncbi:predicted protein [Chaetomium globosum CBS 148.51]|uniref:Uncharacterized protein n=1 Tax=Chaetomium globosum (strain ATCC 6205 / CBS 148.51 / DSM 1962 / NBRC 6347 / NRRL 1970) TaxID=306901 RepID=Q2GVQ9_CHAGB|nr:uncharacterized protein CHGG_07945 [Chaetomium globosum CBS 148.51]EAQ86692.1 predicted protein [Chaetomium globosum CBS 148.51]
MLLSSEWRPATVEAAAGCSATFAPPSPNSPIQFQLHQKADRTVTLRAVVSIGRPRPWTGQWPAIFTAGTNYYSSLSGVQFLLQDESWRRRPHETLDSRQCQSAPGEALQESNMLPAHGWVAVKTSAVAIVQCHGISPAARDAFSEC